MAQKIIQDIYVVKKSIRMIKKSDVSDGFYPTGKKAHEEKNGTDEHVHKVKINKLHTDTPIKEIESTETFGHIEITEPRHVTKNSLMFLWVVCIISIATALFLLSSIFSTATLTITPRSERIDLNDTYNITKDKDVSSSTLHFEVMTIEKSLSKSLETDGEEYIEKKSVGKAVLYNNFSTISQRLINNTRLETKDGLTYRIRESVEIPGMKTILGVKTPGSIEVDIIADMPGDKYNMELTDLKGDFVIPGFKGSLKYTTFYGRLSSDITGGFIGNMKKVSEEKLTSGRTELKNILNEDLLKEVFSKKPEKYILFKDNYYIRCESTEDSSAGSEYKISENCSVNAIVFDKATLASFIAKNKIKDFKGGNVDVMWTDNNSVALTGFTEKPWNETSIRAKFLGGVSIVWAYDRDMIINSILGRDKSVINSIIENNKDFVTEIQATIRPMWKNTFPEKSKKIKIIDTIRDNTAQ